MSGLVSIGGGHSLSPEAAASWERMKRAGNPGRVINSSTRDYATQLDWYRNRGEPDYPKYVANPDESKHVWRPNDKRDKGARALDLNDPARAWMVKHGGAHGWYRPWPDVEPWHFEYRIEHDKHLEDDMPTAKEIIDELLSRRLTTSTGQRGAVKRDEMPLHKALTDSATGGLIVWKNWHAHEAQVKGLVGAVAALAKGEKFDEAKLLAGIRAAAAQGIAEAIEDGVDIDVVVTKG